MKKDSAYVLAALLPAAFSCLLLAGRYLCAGQTGLVFLWASAPLLLFARARWVALGFPLLLLWGAGVWIYTTFHVSRLCFVHHHPWPRAALVLSLVALLTLGAALPFRLDRVKKRFREGRDTAFSGIAAFLLAGTLLGFVQLKVKPPGLLLERFLPGGGWVEAFWLSAYAAFLVQKLSDPRGALLWRPRVWFLFSAVFFCQLALGLSGFERFLMTGKLHLPVPALIVAGPVYRGHGFFMPIIFSVTVLLVGPAWCSWLCYVGAWDDRFCRLGGSPRPLPRWRSRVRIFTLFAAFLGAWWFRREGWAAAALWAAAGFGLAGIAIMVFLSSRRGAMVHCTAWCPIGVLATRLGKVNPFRVRIGEGCTECGACSKACRYDALSQENIKRRRPGESCTLCGDCIALCKTGNIGYGFPRLSAPAARGAFLTVVASLHAVFLGVARI